MITYMLLLFLNVLNYQHFQNSLKIKLKKTMVYDIVKQVLINLKKKN